MQLCVCFDRLGETETAYDYHKRAQALKPEDPAVLYNERYFEGLGFPKAQQPPCQEAEKPV